MYSAGLTLTPRPGDFIVAAGDRSVALPADRVVGVQPGLVPGRLGGRPPVPRPRPLRAGHAVLAMIAPYVGTWCVDWGVLHADARAGSRQVVPRFARFHDRDVAPNSLARRGAAGGTTAATPSKGRLP